jgi:hypothetical protein
MKFIFVDDFFYSDGFRGGAEFCNDELINRLRIRGHEVEQLHSFFFSESILKKALDEKLTFIIGNFLNVGNFYLDLLANSKIKYFIYEHDHKYLATRDPSVFENNLAPKDKIINENFYKNAYKIVSQSKRHKQIISQNLNLENVFQGYNFWRKEQLENLIKFQNSIKEYDASVMAHIYPQKNTKGAIEYCENNKLVYQVIPYGTPHRQFCEALSKSKSLVFFPEVNETLSRVCVEANCLNVEIISNKNISYLDESWSNLRGLDLIDFISNASDETISIFES